MYPGYGRLKQALWGRQPLLACDWNPRASGGGSRCTPMGATPMDEHLTLTEVFSLFGRQPEDTRWVASADSQEYLAVVLYLVQRNDGR